MEQLLSLYNITTVQFFDSNNTSRNYAFSDKMVANNVFIEHYTTDPMEAEENKVVGDEKIEEDDEDPEYGSQLSVIMEHEKKYYQFLMFHSTYEIGVPVMLLQTIIFLTNLIEKTAPDQLIEYLNSICPDPLIPHEIPDKKFRDMANKMLKLKMKTVHNLIQERKADLN